MKIIYLIPCVLLIFTACTQEKKAPDLKGRYVVSHPLDPLNPEEIETAVSVVRGKNISPHSTFPYVYLNEPPKEEVLRFKKGDKFSREAFLNIVDREAKTTWSAIVDLDKKVVKSWEKVENGQPPVTSSEVTEEDKKIVKSDPRWQKAMIDRGFTNFDELSLEIGLPANNLPDGMVSQNRLGRVRTFWKGPHENSYENPYPHIIDTVILVYDITERKVVSFYDYGITPVSKINGDFGPKETGVDPHFLQPLQFKGASPQNYTVNGNEVSWYRWKFRYMLHPRDGLVLYQISYDDRPILYRASLSEVFTPYADPSPAWSWVMPIDEGEFTLGNRASLLTPGKDVPARASVIDSVMTDDKGAPFLAKATIALFEQEGGPIWRDAGKEILSRLGQNLVIEFISNQGNYNYAFSWVFTPQGVIEARISLMGIDLQKQAGEPVEGQHQHLVAPGLNAPFHQHFFAYRLDFEVDGTQNSIKEMDKISFPAKDNPMGNGWTFKDTFITNESMGKRDMNLETSRSWRIYNPNIVSDLGWFPSYDLMPMANSTPAYLPDSPLLKRVEFAKHQLWVTAYNPKEFYAAGDYPNQGPPGEGLSKWITRGASLENTDIVVWYVYAFTHHTAPEDWPVMPTVQVTPFRLMPAGFFPKNPVLNYGNREE